MISNFNINLYSCFNFTFDEGHSFEGHRHHGFEMNIVLSGTLEIAYDNYVLLLNENDIFLGEPFVFHRNKCLKAPTHLIVFQFDSTDIHLTGGPSAFRLSKENYQLLQIILSELQSANFNMYSQNIPPIAEELFRLMLFRLLREEAKPRFSQSREAALYNNTVVFMKQHLANNYSIQDFAKLCGVCTTTLKNAFRRCAGMGVNRFFNELKIDEACRLLQQGVSAYQASVQLGFSSQAYFSAVFKSVIGQTPREYRVKTALTSSTPAL